jgi:putative redox protein
MPTETVRADWIQDQLFLLRDHYGFPIVMTQPEGVNGADLLPLSVIGCAAWDILSILKKQRQKVTKLQVTAESFREAEPPWAFTKIQITYRFGGNDLDEDKIKRAIELSEQNYCSTLATLRKALEITSAYEILESS